MGGTIKGNPESLNNLLVAKRKEDRQKRKKKKGMEKPFPAFSRRGGGGRKGEKEIRPRCTPKPFSFL